MLSEIFKNTRISDFINKKKYKNNIYFNTEEKRTMKSTVTNCNEKLKSK